MSDWRRSSLHTVAIIAGAMLSGCAMAIDTPKNDGDSVCSPVQVGVSWQGTVTNNTFSATLDNVDVTPQFAVDYGNRRATAQLTAPSAIRFRQDELAPAAQAATSGSMSPEPGRSPQRSFGSRHRQHR